MRIGFAKADLTQAIVLKHPEFEVKLISTETGGKRQNTETDDKPQSLEAKEKPQSTETDDKLKTAETDDKPQSAETGEKLHSGVTFSERKKKLLDLSDKKIVELMAERKGISRKIVTPIEMSVMYGDDANGAWAILSFDLCESGYKLVDTIKTPVEKECGRITLRTVDSTLPVGYARDELP